MTLRPVFAIALLCAACSGKTSASGALDGTWKVTMLPTELFGADFTDGQIVINGGAVTATFSYDDVGSTVSPGCTVATDQSVTQLSIAGGSAQGTVTENTTFSGCSGMAPSSVVGVMISAQQTAPEAPTLTPYDGTWTITLSDSQLGPLSTFTLDITGGQWTAATMGQQIASGQVQGTTATATDGDSDFAAQRQ